MCYSLISSNNLSIPCVTTAARGAKMIQFYRKTPPTVATLGYIYPVETSLKLETI